MNPCVNLRVVPAKYKVSLVVVEGKGFVDATMKEAMALELAVRAIVGELEWLTSDISSFLMLSTENSTILAATAALAWLSVDVITFVVVGLLGPHTSHATALGRNFLDLALRLLWWNSFENGSCNLLKLRLIHTGEFFHEGRHRLWGENSSGHSCRV